MIRCLIIAWLLINWLIGLIDLIDWLIWWYVWFDDMFAQLMLACLWSWCLTFVHYFYFLDTGNLCWTTSKLVGNRVDFVALDVTQSRISKKIVSLTTSISPFCKKKIISSDTGTSLLAGPSKIVDQINEMLNSTGILSEEVNINITISLLFLKKLILFWCFIFIA